MTPPNIWPTATLVQTDRSTITIRQLVRDSRYNEFTSRQSKIVEYWYPFLADILMLVALMMPGLEYLDIIDYGFGAQLVSAVLYMVAPLLILHSSFMLPRSRIFRYLEACRESAVLAYHIEARVKGNTTSLGSKCSLPSVADRIRRWQDNEKSCSSALYTLWLAAGNGWFVTLASLAWIGQGVHKLPVNFQILPSFYVASFVVSQAAIILLLSVFFIYYSNLPHKMRVDAQNGLCPACHYDLKATKALEQSNVLRCSECGLALPFVPMPPPEEWRKMHRDPQ